MTTRNDTLTANHDLKLRLDKAARATMAAWLTVAVPGSDPATLDELAQRLSHVLLVLSGRENPLGMLCLCDNLVWIA